MKGLTKIIVLVLLILSVNISIAYSDDVTNLFVNAKIIEVNKTLKGKLSIEYDIDSFVFKAQKSGYYSFYAKGQDEIRGHLYNSNQKYLRSGRVTDDNIVFIVAYLHAGEKVYLKLDSKKRIGQDYTIKVIKDKLPFTKVIPHSSSIEDVIVTKEIKTIRIPLRFYSNGATVGNISKAYLSLISIESEGIIQGQANYNTKTNELELDIYGQTNANIMINFGDEVGCKVKIIVNEVSEKPKDQNKEDKVEQDTNDIVNSDNNSNEDIITNDNYNLKGDCNLDNTVDINDVTSLLDIYNSNQYTKKQSVLSDMDNNGEINFTDALIILRQVSGANR